MDMDSPLEDRPTRVLLVANKTAAGPKLLNAVRDRAKQGPCKFVLLIPNPTHGLHTVVDPEDQRTDEAMATVKRALPALSEAAGTEVSYLIGDPVPLNAVQDAVNLYGFDEIILSTLPTHLSHWLRMDLPSKLSGLRLPLTVVNAEHADLHAESI